MANDRNTKPNNMAVVLFSQLCEQAEQNNLQPGEPKPKESYPVYNFSGREFFEGKDGKVRGRP
jgi:hypothetical protein